MVFAIQAMSTRWEIVLPPQGSHTTESLRAAAEQATDEIRHWDDRLSLFKQQSLVSYINNIAHARPVRLNEREWSLFSVAQDVWRRSDGAFDITVAPLLKRLGLHNESSSAKSEPICGMQHVQLDAAARSLRFALPGIGIDLGAIAKGFALDQAAQTLRDCGITTAFLHAGTSSSFALGTRPDGLPWRVALGPEAHDPVIELVNQSLSVSARRPRPAELAPNTGRSHIVDPRTDDYTDESDLDLAATIDDSALVAEAWSTACLVNGSRCLPPAVSLAVKDHRGSWNTRNLHRANVPASLGV